MRISGYVGKTFVLSDYDGPLMNNKPKPSTIFMVLEIRDFLQQDLLELRLEGASTSSSTTEIFNQDGLLSSGFIVLTTRREVSRKTRNMRCSDKIIPASGPSSIVTIGNGDKNVFSTQRGSRPFIWTMG